jgi:hypothetical protein
LFLRAHANGNTLALNERIDGLARTACDVAVGDGVNEMPVRYEAADGGEMFLPLHLAEHRISAADEAAGHGGADIIFAAIFLMGRLDDADGNNLAVRHLEAIRNVIAGVDLVVPEMGLIDPFFDEHHDAGPRITADAGGIECLRPSGLDILLCARLRIPIADEITSDRRSDHALLGGEMQMVEIARLEQVHE